MTAYVFTEAGLHYALPRPDDKLVDFRMHLKLKLQGAAEVGGEGAEAVGVGMAGVIEDEFELAGEVCAFGIAEHAERAGEFVGGHGGVPAQEAVERGSPGGLGCAVQQFKTIFDHGKIFGPHGGEELFGLGGGIGVQGENLVTI